MKITYSLLFSFFTIIGFGQAGSPASPYYDGFDFSQTGAALRSSLSDKIISTHTRLLTYQDAEDAIKIIDRDPQDLSNQTVLLVYGFSENKCPENSIDFPDHRRRNRVDDGTNSCQWNREHTYPKSRGIPDLGTDGPGADVHHIRASDVSRNANRGNSKFGPGSGNSGYFNGNWYPGDEWKGDIARMMMYMYLRYGNQCLPNNVAVGNLVSTDNNMVDLLLQWNAEDPVSEFEDRRNTYLGNSDNFFAQGNRNPFIDNPYLATLIWGGMTAENRWVSLSTTASFDWSSSVTVYPNPTQNHEVKVSSPVSINTIQLISVNGQIVKEFSTFTNSDHEFTLNNLPNGFFFVKINSNEGATIRKIIVN
jgi:endonuclease I